MSRARPHILLLSLLLAACSSGDGTLRATGETNGAGATDASSSGGVSADGVTAAESFLAASSPDHESDEDWAIARRTLEWGIDQEIDLLPIGERVATLGATFVGVPYLPATLELEGPEGLVVRLTAFDCVTLVEHLVVLARLLPEGGEGALTDEGTFRRRYREELTRLRYRDGVLNGYSSRLHYFSDWIRDAEAKGILSNVTQELGGIVDPRPINFMSAHPDSYRQLGEDPRNLEEIVAIEARLNAMPRSFIPKDRIATIEDRIENGDIIAAVSTVDGLDIAHTGIAVRRAGRVHLLHAPLVGDSVEVSALPLAERIQGFSSQSGIMVARLR